MKPSPMVAVLRGGDVAGLAAALASLHDDGVQGVEVLHDDTCPCTDGAPFADCRCREVWLRLGPEVA